MSYNQMSIEEIARANGMTAEQVVQRMQWMQLGNQLSSHQLVSSRPGDHGHDHPHDPHHGGPHHDPHHGGHHGHHHSPSPPRHPHHPHPHHPHLGKVGDFFDEVGETFEDVGDAVKEGWHATFHKDDSSDSDSDSDVDRQPNPCLIPTPTPVPCTTTFVPVTTIPTVTTTQVTLDCSESVQLVCEDGITLSMTKKLTSYSEVLKAHFEQPGALSYSISARAETVQEVLRICSLNQGCGTIEEWKLHQTYSSKQTMDMSIVSRQLMFRGVSWVLYKELARMCANAKSKDLEKVFSLTDDSRFRERHALKQQLRFVDTCFIEKTEFKEALFPPSSQIYSQYQHLEVAYEKYCGCQLDCHHHHYTLCQVLHDIGCIFAKVQAYLVRKLWKICKIARAAVAEILFGVAHFFKKGAKCIKDVVKHIGKWISHGLHQFAHCIVYSAHLFWEGVKSGLERARDWFECTFHHIAKHIREAFEALINFFKCHPCKPDHWEVCGVELSMENILQLRTTFREVTLIKCSFMEEEKKEYTIKEGCSTLRVLEVRELTSVTSYQEIVHFVGVGGVEILRIDHFEATKVLVEKYELKRFVKEIYVGEYDANNCLRAWVPYSSC